MKTGTERFTLLLPGYRLEFKTATDIFALDIYQQKGRRWKKVVETWAFSGDAEKLLEWLNHWLEIYDDKDRHKKGGEHGRTE